MKKFLLNKFFSHSFWLNKKILITGTNGFIGSHFLEILSLLPVKIITINKVETNRFPFLKKQVENFYFDLLDFEKLKAVSRGMDIIINCAGLDGNSEYKMKNSAEILDLNMKITSNILNCTKDNNIKRVVLLSSAEIYPIKSSTPIREEDDYTNDFDNIKNGYIISKRFTEILGQLYEKQYGVKVYLPRPTNTYGPRDRFQNSSRVISTMIKNSLNNRPIEIWGDGTQIRSFIYVRDLVYSILTMIEIDKYHLLNIDSNNQISIIQLAKLIKQLTRSQSLINLKRNKSGGNKIRVLDNKKLMSICKFRNKNLKEGLKETIKWYKSSIIN